MITPADIKNYEFKTAGRNAYKADDVDSFFGEVLVSYEKLFRENVELVKRISLLADKLETYKKDEDNIKQAVLSAQRAADIIVRDAEESVADAKSEAEAILAAARGEADIIKSDAEKQAIADSDLLLSIARDKAEDIMNKAKEKAHEILIEANNTASNTVGAATRTITSESIHYDMLKKEVSDFRASILAQYKAHIELISKLPELADEEAKKTENTEEVIETTAEITEEILSDDNATEIVYEDSVLEYVETDAETVEKTENESSDIKQEYLGVSLDESDYADEDETETEKMTDVDFSNDVESKKDEENVPADIPISKKFSINAEVLDFDGFENEFATDYDEPSETTDTDGSDDENINVTENLIEDNIDSSTEDSDDDSLNSFFDSIECIETEKEESDTKKSKKGFFRRWK